MLSGECLSPNQSESKFLVSAKPPQIFISTKLGIERIEKKITYKIKMIKFLI